MLNVDWVVSEGAAAGGRAFLSEKVTGAEKKEIIFIFSSNINVFYYFCANEMHDSKMWKEKLKKKQEGEKQIRPEVHTAARCVCVRVWVCDCVWVGVTAGKYSYCFSQRH